MTRRSLRCYGINSADELLLHSMLGLIAGQTSEEWDYEETPTVSPDLGIMSVAVASGLLDDRLPQQAQPRVRAVIGPRLREDDLTLAYPLRPRSLIELLDQASRRLTANGSAWNTAATTATPRFIDQLYALLTGGHGPERLWYRLPDRDLVLVHPKRWTYVTDDLAGVIDSAGRTDVRLQSGGADSRVPDGGEQPLLPLLWSIGMRYRQSLVAPLTLTDAIQVRRWPDLGRLRDDPIDVRIIAQLQRQERTAPQLAEQLALDLGQVIGAFNALLLAAFAVPASRDVTPKPAAPQAPAPNVSLGLLGRIRARLGLG